MPYKLHGDAAAKLYGIQRYCGTEIVAVSLYGVKLRKGKGLEEMQAYSPKIKKTETPFSVLEKRSGGAESGFGACFAIPSLRESVHKS